MALSIRARRRNRWRKKLRRCNQCKHWSPCTFRSDIYSKCEFPLRDYKMALRLARDNRPDNGANGTWWWAATICSEYHAYDRSANQLAQSAQRMSITEVKPCLN